MIRFRKKVKKTMIYKKITDCSNFYIIDNFKTKQRNFKIKGANNVSITNKKGMARENHI